MRRLDLGDVDVEEADRVGLERFLGRLVAFDFRQPADAVALIAAMQRRTRQVRNRGLQGIEAIVERQKRVLSLYNAYEALVPIARAFCVPLCRRPSLGRRNSTPRDRGINAGGKGNMSLTACYPCALP